MSLGLQWRQPIGNQQHGSGKWHGHSTNTWASGLRYVNAWSNDKKHGHGSQTWGHLYGCMARRKNYGHGTETWADGKTHTGTYRDDKRNRRGAITWADGRRHEGAWRESTIHGQGTFTSPPYTKLGKHGRLVRWQEAWAGHEHLG